MKKTVIYTYVILVFYLLCSNAFASTTNINNVIQKYKDKVKDLSSFRVEYVYVNKPFLTVKPHISNRKFIFSQNGNLQSDIFEFILTIDDTLQVMFAKDTIYTVNHVTKKVSREAQNGEIASNRHSDDTYTPLFDDYYVDLLTNDSVAIKNQMVINRYFNSEGALVVRYTKEINNHFLLDSGVIEFYLDTSTYLPIHLSILSYGVEDMEETSYSLLSFHELPKIDARDLYIQDTIMHYIKDYGYTISGYNTPMATAPSQIRRGAIFPDINIERLDNRKSKLYELANKWTVIDFWYSGCVPCLYSLPSLNHFYKNYVSDSISFISVNPYDLGNETNIRKIIKRFNIEYPIYFSDTSITEEYGIHSFPTTIVLDKDKVVVGILIGGSSMPISSRIMSVINGHNKNTPK